MTETNRDRWVNGIAVVAGLARVQALHNLIPKSGDCGYTEVIPFYTRRGGNISVDRPTGRAARRHLHPPC